MGTDSTSDNDALTLLRLQQHVLQLTTAQTALEDIQKLVSVAILAQGRRQRPNCLLNF